MGLLTYRLASVYQFLVSGLTFVVRLVDASQREKTCGRVGVDVAHVKREDRHVDDLCLLVRSQNAKAGGGGRKRECV